MVLIQREVADRVIENDARRCRTFFCRAGEEKAEINDEQDGNNTSRMIHNNNAQIKCCV